MASPKKSGNSTSSRQLLTTRAYATFCRRRFTRRQGVCEGALAFALRKAILYSVGLAHGVQSLFAPIVATSLRGEVLCGGA